MNSKRQVVIISSADRAQGSSSSGNIILQHELDGEYVLEHFACTNALYNVNDSNNQVYADIASNGTETFTLTNGSYTRSELATQLQTQLNTSANWVAAVVVSVDLNTLKFTVSETVGTTSFILEWGTTLNSARKLFGYSASDTAAGTSAVGDLASDITPYKYLFMNVRQSSHDSFSRKGYFTSTFGIYDPSSTFGEVIRYVRNTDMPQVFACDTLRNFRYSFADENCKAIDLNGVNWTLWLAKKI